MKTSDLEKILEQLLEDGTTKTSKAKTIMLNNMLALCRNLNSFQNIVNSFSEKDDYVDDINFMSRDFSTSFCSSTIRKLLSVGINIVDDYDPVMSQRPVIINPFSAIEPPPAYNQPNFAPPYPPYPPQQAPYPPQYQQPVPPAPQPMPQPAPYPPYPPQQAPYPPQYQQPAAPAPQPLPQPAPAPQPTMQQPAPQPRPAPVSQPAPQPAMEQEDTSYDTNDSGGGMDFNFGGGGDDKPAAGRDFLLGLLNKK